MLVLYTEFQRQYSPSCSGGRTWAGFADKHNFLTNEKAGILPNGLPCHIRDSSTSCGLLAREVCPCAQSTVGTILGTVSDPSGAVIAGVNVTVTNTATAISRTVTSDQTGSYKVLRLLPSTYTITAELAGFKKVVLSGITLQVNQDARYDIRMEVGELTQEVSVNAEGVVVQTDDATLGQVVDQQKVVELPLNGSNFMQLVAIGTGAVPIQTSQGGSTNGETGRDGQSYSISGQREVSMSYLVDGVETRTEIFADGRHADFPRCHTRVQIAEKCVFGRIWRGIGRR